MQPLTIALVVSAALCLVAAKEQYVLRAPWPDVLWTIWLAALSGAVAWAYEHACSVQAVAHSIQ